MLERRAGPDDVRRAVYPLRDANFDNISLDLLYGIPGQSAADLERDLEEALALAPEHLSYYELEAKPGTRFTHAHGAELARQAEAMEGYFERVVEPLTGAGYRWYETANFCRAGLRRGRDLRARHNLALLARPRLPRARDRRRLDASAASGWRNTPSLRALPGGARPGRAAGARGRAARRATCAARSGVMLGLRLDEPLPLDGASTERSTTRALERLERLGLAVRARRA